PALPARALQDVLDQVAEPARLPVDDLQGSDPLLLGADAAQQEHLGEHPDLRQRRAQLVGDARDELGAQGRHRPLAPELEDFSRPRSGGRRGARSRILWNQGDRASRSTSNPTRDTGSFTEPPSGATTKLCASPSTTRWIVT